MAKQKYTTEIQLGEEYTDSVTGWRGKATTITFHRTGCERVLLQRLSQNGDSVVFEAFDAEGLSGPMEKKTFKADIELGKRYTIEEHDISGVASTLTFFQFAEERVEIGFKETTSLGTKVRYIGADVSQVVEEETKVPVVAQERQGGGPDRPTAARH